MKLKNEKTTKGFTAFLEIYDERELISKVKAEFDGDCNALTESDENEIREFLILMSGVDLDVIDTTVIDFAEFENQDGNN